MHARHGPFQSVGELGYLLFSATNPWTTVRLGPPYPENYPTNLVRLFDRFTVHHPTNYPRRGLVNPNSRQTNALAALFRDMPVGAGPDGGGQRLTESNALALATTYLQAGGQGMANVSDYVMAFSNAVTNAVVPGAATNKFIRESMIRNSMGLISPRSQLYTVFVAGRTFVEGYDPDDAAMAADRDRYVSAEKRAVAVVWRDAYAQPNGLHRTAIQYFQWLDEE